VHESFRHAVNPKPRHACLRIPLKPLTLGHRFLLFELDSPVVTGEPCGFGDILLAVIVCAQPHEKARRMIRKNWWLRVFAWYWGVRCRGMDLKAEAEKFQVYLLDEQSLPPLAPPPKGQGRAIAAPWEWVLLDLLMSVYRMDKPRALNTPIREANALWAVHGDGEGKVELATAPGGIADIIKGIWKRRRQQAAEAAAN
jgi:hypothetical protein